MKEAKLYKKVDTDTVQCLACNHYCVIAEGKYGKCGVRENRDGKLYLTVYGEVVAQNVDPIEKKPLYHFLPSSSVFSIGTFGCNFTCDFCQNWSISQATDDERHRSTSLSPELIVEYCVNNEIPTIAYTYNEPTIFAEFACDIAVQARENGIKNVFVSNGFMSSEAVELMCPLLDAINIDLKSNRNEFYKKYCNGAIDPVLENIRRFKEAGVWVEVTTLVVPGRNDSQKELESIARELYAISPEIPWHLTAFHPDYQALDVESTPETILQQAHAFAKATGLLYVYTGNYDDTMTQSTLCPHCNTELIERTGNYSTVTGLHQGMCGSCKSLIPGVWK